jgi:hypothetical protein
VRAELEENMRSFDASKGDRIDPIAHACRALYVRVELCPCQFRIEFQPQGCMQCQNDKAAIEAAWDASAP